MFRKNKWITMLALVLSFSILVIGCSSNNAANTSVSTEVTPTTAPTTTPVEATPAPEPVELKIAHGWTGEVAMAAALEPAIEKFMADNVHIKLTVETAPGNAIREKILTEMAANDPPDVFLHWGVRDTASYITNNKLADLTDLIANDVDMKGRYIDGAYQSSTYQGKIYGLPIEAYMYVFLINREMFEEHNIAIPSTFEELKQVVNAFKEKGLIPIASTSGTSRHLLTNFNDQLLGSQALENVRGNGEFDDTLIKSAEYADDLFSLEAYPIGSETLGTLQALEIFNAEQAPMYFQHSWTIGSLSEEMLSKVEIIPFPVLPENDEYYMTTGVGYFVYISQRAAEDPVKLQAAWELAKYLAGPEVGRSLEEVSGSPSPVIMERTDAVHPILKKALDLRDSGIKNVPDHNDLLTSESSAVYNDLAKRLYLKDVTPTEFAEQYKQALKDNPNPAFQ